MCSKKVNDQIADSTCLDGEELEATRERLLDLGIATPEIFASDFHVTEVTASADVFIQAGHLNTPDGKTGASAPWAMKSIGRRLSLTGPRICFARQALPSSKRTLASRILTKDSK